MRNIFSPDHEKDRDRANRLLEKAEKTCLVVRSIVSKVILEPKVIVEEELLDREKMGNSVAIS
jgi:hypothetical protein